MGRDPSRAADPDVQGVVERNGVALAYEVFGQDHQPTVVLVPTWSIVPSRFWKAQVGYLSRHYRVVTFDGRGSGRSGRPVGAAAYTDGEYCEDIVAVMDATGTDQAVLVSISCGGTWSVHVAAKHPHRVLGLFAIGPACGLSVTDPEREQFGWSDRLTTTEGWAKYNKHYWLEGGYDDFVRFFFDKMYPELHSTKQREDCVGWAHEISPATLADTTAGRLGVDGAVREPLEPLCAKVTCPVVVVHGTNDQIRSHAIGEKLAELTGGSLVLLEGSGHGVPGRDPVRINQLIAQFVDRVQPPPPARTTWVHASSRPRRVLYLSSPIGLGHAQRDAAIAAELRARHPDVEIDWLAQHPVTTVLQDRGERIHPASGWLRNESGHIEHESGEHDLHAFLAIRRMDEILVHNFMVFSDVVAEQDYDLVVGDEAWDVDYFLHENPELKRFAFAWMTDFVGWLPMPDGGAAEAALTTDYNAEMIEQRARFARIRDRSVFVGSPDDIVDADFGPGLPRIRDWTQDNFAFSGYVTGFDPAALQGTEELRHGLGIGPDEKLCLVTVGGSGVGAPLLRRVLDAVPLVRQLSPELRFLFVTGPRIDPASLPATDGVDVVGYLPDLFRHLAASDLAVVQGGLTTTMELTALRKPFVYIPLRHHFEQNLHVRTRLDRYGAGRMLPFETAQEPDALAEAIAKEVTREVAYLPVETDGAARAADLLAQLI
ncbi:alpha/beta fold hydrolase [Angustibacter sp. McL0619]|uniref:alpha/beta fold hydrolase n=1 Tax=Angustibacter sp. McL0619 TaxID=3415676 RepID=UPI003CF776B0